MYKVVNARSKLLIPLTVSSAVSPKPVIFISPPWTTFFKEEKVLLTCDGFHFYAPGKTQWYQNGKILQDISGNNITINKSGKYRCKTNNSPLSDIIKLTFVQDSLILRIPYLVFEGDSLILRCQEKNNHHLTKVKYYKNSKSFSTFNQSSDVVIPQASLSNRSSYHCTALKNMIWKKSDEVTLNIHELFSRPVLETIDSQPIEGSPVTLSCKVWIPPEKSSIQLLFSFFRDPGAILLGQTRTQELQISKLWMEDSGFYWCKVETVSLLVSKRSRPIRMSVKRIPISGVHIEVQPQGGHVMEGQKLVLLCSVAGGSGTITFSWHREGTEASLGKKIQRSLVAEFVFSAIRENDAGIYYCTADNNSSLIPSHSVTITVRKTPVAGDLTYSEVWSALQGKEGAADVSKKPPDDKDCSVIYSVIKKTKTLGDSTGNSRSASESNGDTADGYVMLS
ncbi:Fc receptor-like protein 4 [Gracilinanus agilis]|uniref:Fc receptor-like protein 4 n=1 Tax=Gracilinanus agilis TaxID=191870 RepID=UPI001CFF138F|nr:Fc receptor-like protein 4 [Gracilinanus agilis]